MWSFSGTPGSPVRHQEGDIVFVSHSVTCAVAQRDLRTRADEEVRERAVAENAVDVFAQPLGVHLVIAELAAGVLRAVEVEHVDCAAGTRTQRHQTGQ